MKDKVTELIQARPENAESLMPAKSPLDAFGMNDMANGLGLTHHFGGKLMSRPASHRFGKPRCLRNGGMYGNN